MNAQSSMSEKDFRQTSRKHQAVHKWSSSDLQEDIKCPPLPLSGLNILCFIVWFLSSLYLNLFKVQQLSDKITQNWGKFFDPFDPVPVTSNSCLKYFYKLTFQILPNFSLVVSNSENSLISLLFRQSGFTGWSNWLGKTVPVYHFFWCLINWITLFNKVTNYLVTAGYFYGTFENNDITLMYVYQL